MDIPNVNRIVHYGAPSSMDMYVQESGRAGREGQQADCIILYHRYALSGQTTAEVKSYMKGTTCRRTQILKTFNLFSESSGSLLCCDICSSGYSCCSCPLHIQCTHTGEPKCYCVKWCAVVGVHHSFKSITTSVARVKVRSKISNITELEDNLHHLESISQTLPVSTIYPQLIHNIVTQHEYIEGNADVIDLGAFSVADAGRILAILDKYSHVFDLDQSMSGLNLDSDSE